jgi:hypothetical protein
VVQPGPEEGMGWHHKRPLQTCEAINVKNNGKNPGVSAHNGLRQESAGVVQCDAIWLYFECGELGVCGPARA